MSTLSPKIIHGDCLKMLEKRRIGVVDVTFLDPPFNQDKEYASWNDNLPAEKYWEMMKGVCRKVYECTSEGGALYFMQREKNTEFVLRCMRESGWTFQNLIVWKKKTSAVPCVRKFGKQYQIIAFATKGATARVFNRLRISPPLPANYKYEREGGIFVTDVWDDIRELTAGYFAGDEALRKGSGERFHKQQSPLSLLVRIILSSTAPGDTVLDPFAGTGTTLVAAKQLGRQSIGLDIDKENVECMKRRVRDISTADNIARFYKEYLYTDNLARIWPTHILMSQPTRTKTTPLF